MEVLLWLWLYDSRWLFNWKAPLSLYRMIWVLAMLINGFMCCAGVLHVLIQETTSQMFVIAWANIVLCGICLVLSIGFVVEISKEQKKHVEAHEHVVSAIPGLKEVVHVKDFWVRNRSISSTMGLLLLLCSLAIAAFTSVILGNKDKWLDSNIKWLHEQNIVYYYSMYQLTFLLFCVTEFLLSILIKLTSLASVYLCKDLHVKVSKVFNGASKRKTLDFSHIQAKYENQAKTST